MSDYNKFKSRIARDCVKRLRVNEQDAKLVPGLTASPCPSCAALKAEVERLRIDNGRLAGQLALANTGVSETETANEKLRRRLGVVERARERDWDSLTSVKDEGLEWRRRGETAENESAQLKARLEQARGLAREYERVRGENEEPPLLGEFLARIKAADALADAVLETEEKCATCSR